MGESTLHFKVEIGLRDDIKDQILTWLDTTDDKRVQDLFKAIDEHGTATIKYDSKIHKQADVSFGPAESRDHVQRKSRQYLNLSDGKVQAVLIVDIQYPDMKKAWFRLLTIDDLSSPWVLFYDDDLNPDQQPTGEVALYLSDFLGLAPGIPAVLCRPSATEVSAGITRNPTIAISYERLRAIFRRARRSHDPKKFTKEEGDEPENIRTEGRMEGLKQGLKQGRQEGRAKCIADIAQCLGLSNEELERRLAAMEPRVTEGRSEAE
ncbi:hypothetical protein B0J18DRAFT_436945 [Chaetomium sp. MPI-SDFR-AT-0129]|nr:hypothetical protein B0J18DRAFT_436945 [Chaetomium sp. MPI-SDFR-AT-0129]